MWNPESDRYGSEYRSGPSYWTNNCGAPPPYQPRPPPYQEAINHQKNPKRSCCQSILSECTVMCVGCMASLARCILILINTFLAFVGLAFIVTGSILRFSKTVSSSVINLLASSTTLMSKVTGFDMDSLTRLLGTAAKYINETTVLLIAFGVVILVISIIGLCGATLRSRGLLRLYVLFIASIALVIVILAIVLHEQKGYVKRTSQAFLMSKFTSIYGNDTAFTNTFNAFMEIFKCCGVKNGTDFVQLNNTQWKATFHQVVPQSCCMSKHNVFEKCTEKPTIDNSYRDVGCFKKFWSAVERYSEKIVIGLSCTVLVLCIFIFLTCLIIKNESNKVE